MNLVQQGNWCCRTYIIKNHILEDLGLLKVHSNTTSITALQLSKIIETLFIRCDSSLFDKVGKYGLSEKQREVSTGQNWKQHNALNKCCSYCETLI